MNSGSTANEYEAADSKGAWVNCVMVNFHPPRSMKPTKQAESIDTKMGMPERIITSITAKPAKPTIVCVAI